MKSRQFNISGPCVPALHYMVDTSAKIDEIVKRYIDKGEYFAINRARQYGKTTTLELLYQKLIQNNIVLDISFEGDDDAADSRLFIENFILSCEESLRQQDVDESIIEKWISGSDSTTFLKLGKKITELVNGCLKPVILMIDEVDKISDNSVFVNFLGLLRKKFIRQRLNKDISFKSVVLVGVHDIKNLKNKIRPEEQHSYNSPWNIAAAFDIDMSFNVLEIAGMLSEYENDYHTGMDTDAVAERIYYYTSGYPFLVSDLCKVIHDNSLEWSEDGVDDAEQRVLKEKSTLFDDVTKNIVNNLEFRNLVKRILLYGASISFEEQNPEIDMGVMYGIFSKDANDLVKVSNIIFETRIYNYFISVEATSAKYDNVASEKSLYIEDVHLNMTAVMNRFSQFMYSEYRDENAKFIEKQASLLFLCYLKPIINGTGHYVVEPQTRGNRRMDIVVFFGREEHIIELKIWRGEQYEQDGLAQLADYLRSRGQKHGYLLSFCDNVKAPRSGGTLKLGDCEITEVIIAYRDKS